MAGLGSLGLCTLGLGLGLASLSGCASTLDPGANQADWRRAEVATAEGDWGLAADLWNRLRHANYGDHTRPHLETAAALAELGQREDALALLDRALELFPDHPSLLASRARLLASMGFHRAAELDLLEAVDQTPGDPALWAALGEIQLSLEEPRKAAVALDQALVLGSARTGAVTVADGSSIGVGSEVVGLRRVDVYRLAARAHRGLGALARSHDLYARALHLSEDPAAELLVEAASLHTDRPEDAPDCPLLSEALVWAQAAIEDDPQCSRAAFVLGCLLDRKGELDEAIVAYRRAVEIDNLHLGALTNLAVAHSRMGESARCAAMVERALALEADERRRKALLALIALESDEGEVGEADRDLR